MQETTLEQCRQETLDWKARHRRAMDFLSSVTDTLWEMDADLRVAGKLTMTPGPDGAIETLAPSVLGGASIRDIVGEEAAQDPAFLAHLEELRAHRPFRSFIFRQRTTSGDVRWFESNGNPIFDEQGAFLGYRGIVRDVTRYKQAEAHIAFMARHDELTRLPNRWVFWECVEHALARSRRGPGFAVMYLDLDRFKAVNDTFGHDVGDLLLRAVAERALGAVRETDTVARLGGDEFAVVLADVDSDDQAACMAERLSDAIGATYCLAGHRLTITCTIGISFSTPNDESPDEILKRADLAMYRARRDHSARYRFFDADAKIA